MFESLGVDHRRPIIGVVGSRDETRTLRRLGRL